MAEKNLNYAEPEFTPLAIHLVETARKMAKSFHYRTDSYAFNYKKPDGSFSNPNAEEYRITANFLTTMADELERLHRKTQK